MQKNFAYRFSRRTSTRSSLAQFTESPAYESVTTLLDRCDDYKTYTADFTNRIRKQCRTGQAFIDDGKKAGETLLSFHQKCQQAKGDPVLLDCFGKTRDFHLNFFDLFDKLNGQLDSKITNSMAENARVKFQAVKTAKKNFQKAKSSYEAVLTASKGKKKQSEIEAEVEEAREAYFATGSETLTLLQDSVKEVELSLLAGFCGYWDSFYDFQSKSAKWVTNIRPMVEKYREHLKEETKQHEAAKKSRSKGGNSFAAAANAKIFGTSLETLMERTTGPVPLFVDQIITHLTKIGPPLEGVFRISAMKSSLVATQERIDSGERVNFADLDDPHISAALFKQFLRELPEPLLTFRLYTTFLNINSIGDETKRFEELKKTIQCLPEVNRALFKRLLNLLSKIAENQEVNKMGFTNLSTVIGPNILYAPEINPMSMVEDMENANAIIVTCISQYHELFKIEDPLQAAREDDFKAFVRLHKEGKDISGVDETKGMNALHYFCSQINMDAVEYIVSLPEMPFSVNQQDNEGKTALMYSCQADDRSQIIAQFLMDAKADSHIAANDGKTVWDLASSISSEFVELLESLTEESTKDPTPVVGDDSTPAISNEGVGEGTKEISQEEGSSPVCEEKIEPEPEPEPVPVKEEIEATKEVVVEEVKEVVKAPVKPVVPKATPEEIAARSKEKAAALLRSKMKERNGSDAERRADDAVNDLIFERVRSLHSLVSQDIPLPSVYSFVNINEITIAIYALLKPTVATSFGAPELGALNGSLKACAGALKNLFGGIKKFASLFDDGDKKEVLSAGLAFQSAVKTLVGCAKELNGKPGDSALKEKLTASTKQMTDCAYKFFKFCELASLDYITTASQACAENITKIIEAGAGESKDDLDAACETAAFSSLKTSQLVKARAAQCCNSSTRVSLTASASIVERTTLELINESKKLWAQGAKPDDDINTLAKKVFLELRQVNKSAQEANQETNLSITEQGDKINSLADSTSSIIQQLMEITFTSDLDKALVLQMRLIGRKLEGLVNIDSLEPKVVMSLSLEVIEALKKMRVGLNAMEAKSRDKSLICRMRVWQAALQNFVISLRFAVCSLLLSLPYEREIQFAILLDGAVAQCSDFYQFLIELRT